MPKPSNPEIPGWLWQPDKCPCDLQFMEWLEQNERPGGAVFHMGTGMHHNVGLTCSDMGLVCIGVTASTEEYLCSPISNMYQVLLGDIYQLDVRLLPMFTSMTLFHLGEMVDKFGDIHEPNVKHLISKVAKGGNVIFYTGSSAWDRAVKIVSNWIREGVFKESGTYKDLLICRV